MPTLVLLLFFVSIVCLILGLVKPTIFSNFIKGEVTRKKIASIFCVATYAFFVLVNITNPHTTDDHKIHILIASLLLASIVCLILGLVKPTIFSYFIRGDITRKKITSIFGVASLAFLFIGIIGAQSVKKGKTATTTSVNQVNIETSKVDIKVSISPLIEAAIHGRFEEVKRLLDEGADVNAKDIIGVTLLMHASAGGKITVVRLLLDRGADVMAKDNYGNTAMILASKTSHFDVVKLLEQTYEDKIKQTSQDTSAISSAPNKTQDQSNTKTKENQVALDSGKDIVKASKFSLIESAEKGHLEEVKHLLDEGADVNTRDDDGQTALMKASKEGHVEIVKLFVNKGANVNSEDNYRRTAQMLASFEGHHEVENLLKASTNYQGGIKEQIVDESSKPELPNIDKNKIERDIEALFRKESQDGCNCNITQGTMGFRDTEALGIALMTEAINQTTGDSGPSEKMFHKMVAEKRLVTLNKGEKARLIKVDQTGRLNIMKILIPGKGIMWVTEFDLECP